MNLNEIRETNLIMARFDDEFKNWIALNIKQLGLRKMLEICEKDGIDRRCVMAIYKKIFKVNTHGSSSLQK